MKSLVASRQRAVSSPTGFSGPCIVTEITRSPFNFNHTVGRPAFFYAWTAIGGLEFGLS